MRNQNSFAKVLLDLGPTYLPTLLPLTQLSHPYWPHRILCSFPARWVVAPSPRFCSWSSAWEYFSQVSPAFGVHFIILQDLICLQSILWHPLCLSHPSSPYCDTFWSFLAKTFFLPPGDILLKSRASVWFIYLNIIVIYGCESWTIKKAEHQRIDAFELWCWRRFLRVPWTARRSNQSIQKEISAEYSLEGLMLKL